MDDLEMPVGLELARTTPELDQDTAPVGLRSAHRIAEDVWGRLVVRDGALGFVFEDSPDDVRRVGAGEHQVIPPQRHHHLEIDGPVRFVVEFHRGD